MRGGLLELSRSLHEARSLGDAADRVVSSISACTRYRRAWLLLPISPSRGLEVVGYALADRVRVERRMADYDFSQDALLQNLLSSTQTRIIPDLRESEANQEQVAYFGNRTSINIPMLRVAERVGIFVVGTFAEEGVLLPTEEELDFIEQVAALVSIVAGRIRAEEAQRLAEEKHHRDQRLEALGRMAGEIAHDFNNLLLSVMGNAELARRALDSDHPSSRFLGEIQQASDRAAGLTRQLLAFSRGQPIQQRPIDLEKTIRAFLPVMEALLPPTLTIEVSCKTPTGQILADAGQIEQVVMNLLINARDASPQGGTIEIALEQVSVDFPQAGALSTASPGEYVLLSVRDSGIGMSPEISRQIFEPFFSTKAAGVGTGLGLAAVEGIVRRHGGFVRVQSEVGRGSTFRIFFPACRQVTPQEPPALSPPRPARHARLLVVDDDKQIRALLTQVLSEAGYEVHTARNGQDALEQLQLIEGVSLVVSDLVMPVMDGAALHGALQQIPDAPPLLLLTGYLRNAAMRDFEHTLTKPFSSGELLEKVRKILDSPPSRIVSCWE